MPQLRVIPNGHNYQVVDETGSDVQVKKIPAVRGPLLFKYNDQVYNPFNLLYEQTTGTPVPAGFHAVPVTGDYSNLTDQLVLESVKFLDKQYRNRPGSGRRSDITLTEIRRIKQAAKRNSIKSVAAKFRRTGPTVSDIVNGARYWYA